MRYLSRIVEIFFKAAKEIKRMENCMDERFLVELDCQRLFLLLQNTVGDRDKRNDEERNILYFSFNFTAFHCLVFFCLRRIKRIDFCSLNSKPNQCVTQSA